MSYYNNSERLSGPMQYARAKTPGQREHARTAAKFVYIKLCRRGHLGAAGRVLRLLRDNRVSLGTSEPDHKAHLALEAEHCIPYRLYSKGSGSLFLLT